MLMSLTAGLHAYLQTAGSHASGLLDIAVSVFLCVTRPAWRYQSLSRQKCCHSLNCTSRRCFSALRYAFVTSLLSLMIVFESYTVPPQSNWNLRFPTPLWLLGASSEPNGQGKYVRQNSQKECARKNMECIQADAKSRIESNLSTASGRSLYLGRMRTTSNSDLNLNHMGCIGLPMSKLSNRISLGVAVTGQPWYSTDGFIIHALNSGDMLKVSS